MAQRRRRTSMADIGLAPGAVLTLDRDETVTCRVLNVTQVAFNGEHTSLSAAALSALQALGYEWTTANGWAHWTHEGRSLRDLMDEHLARS